MTIYKAVGWETEDQDCLLKSVINLVAEDFGAAYEMAKEHFNKINSIYEDGKVYEKESV
jgi:hypothetical protein